MRADARIAIATIAAVILATATYVPGPRPAPDVPPVDVPRSSGLTDVQKKALEPLAFILRWRQAELGDRLAMVRYLLDGQRIAVVSAEDGGVPIDVELPLVARGELTLPEGQRLRCASACKPVDSRLIRQPCPAEDPGGRWTSLRAPARTEQCPNAHEPLPNWRMARCAEEIRRELCRLRAQIDELDTIIPKSLAARPPEQVFRCLAEESGVQVRDVLVGAPEDVAELRRGYDVRDVPIVAVVEGPPAAVQGWFVRVGWLPEIAWTDAVVLRSEELGSPVVVADARMRIFIRPDPA